MKIIAYLSVMCVCLPKAVLSSVLLNLAFETWECRQRIRVRTLKIRCIHTLGFEAGLFLFCLPIYILWYSVGVWTAMYMESALLLFFLIYTFVFTWLFDQVFTLPQQS